MHKTDNEIDDLLGSLEEPSSIADLSIPMQMMRHDLVTIIRLQQDQIKKLQDIPKNFWLGIKVLVYVGGLVSTGIATFAGILAIKGYFKS